MFPRASLFAALLLTAISPVRAVPQVGAIQFDDLFARQAASVYCPTSVSQPCGVSHQLCCPMGGCYTDSNTQAQCSTPVVAPIVATTLAAGWTMVTTTITGVGPYTVTSTYSTSIGAVTGASTPQCNYQQNESPCGNICCASNQVCFNNQCVVEPQGGSSGYYTSYYSMMTNTNSAGVPVRPTSSTLIIITAGPSTTATVVGTTSTTVSANVQTFQTPVATGANITVTQAQASGGGGLSGGAIAGIVIGVLIALFILGLICFYCCLKGILDGCLALFGLGRKRQRKEVDEYERYSHHGASGGRTWYGARKPARRDDRRDSRTKEVLGIGAALAALWAILGLKRRNEKRKQEEKQSEYSYYSSDYYTSESSASSDRRTRDDRDRRSRR